MESMDLLHQEIIKSHKGAKHDIARVMFLMFKERLKCFYKIPTKHNSIAWRIKIDDVWFECHISDIYRLISNQLSSKYAEVAKICFDKAYKGNVIEHPYYIEVCFNLLKIHNSLKSRVNKNKLVKELEEFFIA